MKEELPESWSSSIIKDLTGRPEIFIIQMLVRSAQPPSRDLPLSPSDPTSSWTASSPSDLRKVLVGDAEHMTVDELF